MGGGGGGNVGHAVWLSGLNCWQAQSWVSACGVLAWVLNLPSVQCAKL